MQKIITILITAGTISYFFCINNTQAVELPNVEIVDVAKPGIKTAVETPGNYLKLHPIFHSCRRDWQNYQSQY